MCNMALLLFGKLPQRNLHVNCHVSGTTFQSGLSSLPVSCKRSLITHIMHTRTQMTNQSLHKYIVKFLKTEFLKTTGIAKYDIKVGVILANKYEVKAESFIIPFSVYGYQLFVTSRLFPSLFFFLSSSKLFSWHLKNKKKKMRYKN